MPVHHPSHTTTTHPLAPPCVAGAGRQAHGAARGSERAGPAPLSRSVAHLHRRPGLCGWQLGARCGLCWLCCATGGEWHGEGGWGAAAGLATSAASTARTPCQRLQSTAAAATKAALHHAAHAPPLTCRPMQGDIPASQMLNSIPGVDPARRQRLIDVLDIDPTWRMNLVSGGPRRWASEAPAFVAAAFGVAAAAAVTARARLFVCAACAHAAPRPRAHSRWCGADGQRRRVQIAMGLLKPFQVLLLDEITVDLDVLGRADLMGFLKDECRERGATIIYVRPPRVWGGSAALGGVRPVCCVRAVQHPRRASCRPGPCVDAALLPPPSRHPLPHLPGHPHL